MIFTSPESIAKRDFSRRSVFLGGSIEMGKSIDWQKDLANLFLEADFNIFNPRRLNWDPSWEQTFENPYFYQQVNWELNALKISDIIIMYFIPETISPISLLEFGKYSTSDKMHVICPDGYFRKGNIECVCNIDNIPLYDNLDEFKEKFVW